MKEFDRLVEIFERLRAPGGCPWDAEQDHRSIAKSAVEEAYELVDAIDSGDVGHMREELGDVLLQVLFHSTIAKEYGEFTIIDVINGLAEKLIHRHPHVFGDADVSGAEEVVKNWEVLKRKEKGKQGRRSILDGIPGALSALLSARKIQSAMARVGFDWKDVEGVIGKIREEASELADAMRSGRKEEVEDELGDLLFGVVNLARHTGIDPEAALRKTNRKVRKRFLRIEEEAERRGVPLESMDLQDMDAVWEKAKEEDGPA